MQNKVNIHVWCLPILMLFLFLPLPSLPNWFLGWFRWQIGSSPSVFILLPAEKEEGRTNKLKTKHFLRIRNVKQSCKMSENPPINLKLTNQDIGCKWILDIFPRWLQTLKMRTIKYFYYLSDLLHFWAVSCLFCLSLPFPIFFSSCLAGTLQYSLG